mmetsp:Transcript_16540/g.18374  ORF Transcript_16540/g.18374 Transcript_16540/m.18374 type:complete len:354 (+) Transcript_16540:112-1173(+)|eukprot:CAMPEP_0194135712 /NCGR_PEP_ID=MMETSP0152-20130528/5791_1 /TAXON_ID=1049557 /ORGANISM="Thalassiothrix antarctica, Strain L6-D1" /LENGTH=353 /DNA_ID=CAMNT_0038832065 /DNA_START=78 /DNA_END=1139 /DNA_ORIENTATION=-
MVSTFGSNTGAKPKSIGPNDFNVPQAGQDGISGLTWSSNANILVSSNWDGGLRCWEVQEQNGQIRALPKAQANHEAKSSVLDCCFSVDGTTVFSGGTDKAVRMWQLQGQTSNGMSQQIGVHDAPVKSVRFLRHSNLVVSGGWDKKLKFWDARSPNPVGVLDMPDRIHSMDAIDNLLVVACANRQIISYDVSGQPREHSRKESPLKFQSRCITCFPDRTGFALGSIEGRVAIQYLQKVQNKDLSFAFKCHRQESNVYAVNDICFNKQFGTFATVGADGVVNFWDKDNKQRLKSFPQIEKSIACANWNAQGNILAYASSYDWSKGSSFHTPTTPDEIFLHYTPEEEIKPKKARKK